MEQMSPDVTATERFGIVLCGVEGQSRYDELFPHLCMYISNSCLTEFIDDFTLRIVRPN